MKSKKTVCNLIIIDASGSMSNKASEVKGGLKTLFSDIKNNKDVNHHTIICDFSGSGDFNVLVNTSEKKSLKDEIAEKYSTRGMTALYDAIGKAFMMVPKLVDGVFVSIITDGEENDSKEYKSEDVKKLIDKCKKKNWGITFMGTSQEAVIQAQNLGISAGNTIRYADSSKGMKMSNTLRSKAMQTYTVALANSDDATFSTSVSNLFDTTEVKDIIAE